MEFRDQMGSTIRLETAPKRVISLVPSLTEMLFDLGLDEEIVGITDTCILPRHKVAGRTRIGGIRQIDLDLIARPEPDLLIGCKEENDREEIHTLQARYPVWMSDIASLDDALEMIRGLGEVVGRRAQAEDLVAEITAAFDALPAFRPVKAAYIIWSGPCMAAGGNTFVNDMMRRCGLVNIFENKSRYPQIELSELQTAEVIMLSSEPYSFTAVDLDSFRKAFPDHQVLIVDGMMFSWYGSRMKHAPRYFENLRQMV